MSNPFKVGDQVIVESGMSKKLIGLYGEVMYIDGEFCEVALTCLINYDRLHYLALSLERPYIKVSGLILKGCDSCGVKTQYSELTEDGFCPECDLKRGAETLKDNKPDQILPEDAQERKARPVFTGFFSYFPKVIESLRKNKFYVLHYPRSILEIAHQSHLGHLQHYNPDEDMHWDKSKSADDKDAFLRHYLEGDLVPACWRLFAVCEKIRDKGELFKINIHGVKDEVSLIYALNNNHWLDILIYLLPILEKELEK